MQKACGPDTGQGGRDTSNLSPDVADVKNLVLQNLDSVHSSQQHLLQLWHHKKLKLDQCFQLRLFEQDCEKVQIQKLFGTFYHLPSI